MATMQSWTDFEPHHYFRITTRLSLQGARNQFNQFRQYLAQATTKNRHRLYTTLLAVISEQIVPLRPNRAEPRVTKRIPKSFPRMQQPRSVLKAKLVA